jgi:hypothetical protein
LSFIINIKVSLYYQYLLTPSTKFRQLSFIMSSEQPATDAAVTVQVFATSTIILGENGDTASATSAAVPANTAAISSGNTKVGEPTTTTAPNAEQSSFVQEAPSQQGSSFESNQANSQPTASQNNNNNSDNNGNNIQPSSTLASLSDNTQSLRAAEISSQGPSTSASEALQVRQPTSTSQSEMTSAKSLAATTPEVTPSTTIQATSFEASGKSVSVVSTISAGDSVDTTVTFVITSTSTVQLSLTSETSTTTSSQSIQTSLISSTSSPTKTSFSTVNTAAVTSSGSLASGTSNDNGGGLSKGGTIGIAVAVPVGVILIAAILGFFLWKRHKNAKDAKSQRLAEVNDYSYNPNNSNTGLNLPGGSGPGGAALFGLNGATTASDAGSSKATSNNYRGWGPTPKSPQMEQVQGGNAFPNNGRLTGVTTAAATSAALARHGSSSEGEQSTHQRGSEELMIPQNSNIPNVNNTHGNNYDGNDPHSSTYYPPYNPNRPQFEFSQQQHDVNGFDFDDIPKPPSPAARYFNEARSETPTQQRQLHIQNVAARRDSPKIEYSSWPDLQHESSSGTHGVSQNF